VIGAPRKTPKKRSRAKGAPKRKRYKACHVKQLWFTPEEWSFINTASQQDGAANLAEWMREQLGLPPRY
jgi:hypothetical protein